MIDYSSCDIVAVKVLDSSNVVFCAAPYCSFLKRGDRVVFSSNSDSGFHIDIDGVCVSDARFVEPETTEIIRAVCAEQFPLRIIKAKYTFDRFTYPTTKEESEVANE